ncbi:MAG: ankyrin repeat domain-containing protein [Deltaproteobacteria bacterium]|nr:ankyrin repeat domain-containing protein [Deltaproteobacteria bacterium]
MASAHGLTPLELALWEGYNQTALILLSRGADPKLKYPVLFTNNLEIHNHLLKLGANDVYHLDPEEAPFQLRFRHGSIQLRDLLEEEEKTGQMNPSIAVAVMFGRSPEVITELIKEGSDINEVTTEYQTALLQAIFRYQPLSYIEFLLKSGADPNVLSVNRNWPLHLSIDSSAIEYRFEVVELLLKYGAKFQIPNARADENVFKAALDHNKDNLRLVNLLLKYGADINQPLKIQSDMYYPPIVLALYRSGAMDMVCLLLAFGADVNAKDYKSRTALHHATSEGWTSMVKVLVDAGANVKAKDDERETAFDYAQREKDNKALLDALEIPE